MDELILQYVSQLHAPFIDALSRFASFLGEHGGVWIVLAAVLLCFRRTRAIGVAVAVSLILSLVFTNIMLKNIVARMRPYDALPWVTPRTDALPHDLSFPSGHASASVAAATAVCAMLRRLRRRGGASCALCAHDGAASPQARAAAEALPPLVARAAGVAVCTLATLICLSRVWLLVHYPSDVLCGIAVGFACGIVVAWLATKLMPLLTRRQNTL